MLNKNTVFNLKRAAGYLLGFALLYAPFELYRKLMENLLDLQPAFLPHAFCPRIPTAEIFTGGFWDLNSIMLISTLLFWLLCLFFGPFFCGRLCIAGYFAESLSHLMPQRLQIEWEKYVPVSYIRYGMLLAYMLLPLWYGFYPCTYCNFYFFDSIVSVLFGAVLSFTVPLAATGFLYLVLFGLFTKGGRGYCRFMCPQGAMQSLFFAIGTKMRLANKIQIDRNKCIKCQKCVKNCPMSAMSMQDGSVQNNVSLCIKCGVCEHNCPVKAISTGGSRL